MAEIKKEKPIDPAEVEKKAANKKAAIDRLAQARAKKAKKKKEEENTPFEEREDLKKLLFYVIIVNYGQGDTVVKLLKSKGTSAQFVQIGEGTATKQVLSVLHIEETRKEIIYSFIRDDLLPDLKTELEAYFLSSKRNAGIAFTIDLNTIVGVKLYKFLTQTVRG